MRSPFHFFIPDRIYASVWEIPFSTYRRAGKKVLILDIDNTLVSYDTAEPDPDLISFLKDLKELGFFVALVSNNSPERVERFNASLGFFAVPDAKKPRKSAFRTIVERFHPEKDEVLVVGDQLFTDVLSAHLWGFEAVVVEPVKKRENRFFRLKRFLEKPFRRAYERKRNKEKSK